MEYLNTLVSDNLPNELTSEELKNAKLEHHMTNKIQCKFCDGFFADKYQLNKHIRNKRCKKQFLEKTYEEDMNKIKANIEKSNHQYILQLEQKNNNQQLIIDTLEIDIEKYKVYENIYKEYYKKNIELINKNQHLETKTAKLITENTNLKTDIENMKKKYIDYQTIIEELSKKIQIKTLTLPDNYEDDYLINNQPISEEIIEIPGLKEKVNEIFTINGLLDEKSPDLSILTPEILSYGIHAISYMLIKSLYTYTGGISFLYNNKNRSFYNKFTTNYSVYLKQNMKLIKGKSEKDLKEVLRLYIENYNKQILSGNIKHKYSPSSYVLFDKHRNYYYYLKYKEINVDGHKSYSVELVKDIDGKYISKWFHVILEYIEGLDIAEGWKDYYKKHLGQEKNYETIIRDMKKRMVDDKYTYTLNKNVLI